MSVTIKTSYQHHEPLGENFDRDAPWIAEHRMELYEKYGDCVILVYQEEVIGHGASVPEAKALAENYLSDKEGIITLWSNIKVVLIGLGGKGYNKDI